MTSHARTKTRSIGQTQPMGLQLLVLIVCLHWISASASPYITNFTRESGLPQVSITRIVMTQDGYLLFGTQDGLAVYDGYKMQNVFADKSANEIDSTFVTAIAGGPSNSTWVGTKAGVLRLDNLTNQVVSNTFEFTNAVVTIKVDREQNLYLGTATDGLFVSAPPYDQVTKLNGLPDGLRISDMAFSADDVLWLATKEKGLYRVSRHKNDKQAFVTTVESIPLPNPAPLATLYFDRDNRLWVSYVSQPGVNVFTISENSLTPVALTRFDAPLTADPASAFLQDKQGDMWIGFDGETGLLKLDFATNQYKQYKANGLGTGLISNKVRSLFEDNNGSLWVGTANGLSQINLTQSNFGYHGGESANRPFKNKAVYALHEDTQATMWLSIAEQGVFVFDDHSQQIRKVDQLGTCVAQSASMPAQVPTVFAFAQRHPQKMWLATAKGICELSLTDNSSTKPPSLAPLSSLPIYDIKLSKKGNLWIIAGEKAFVYLPQQAQLCSLENNIASAYSLFPYEQGMLIYSSEFTDGLRYGAVTGEDCEIINIETVSTNGFNAVEPLLLDSKGNLWARKTSQGLFRFDEDFKNGEAVQRPDRSFGKNVWGALEDEFGHIWISSNNGLAKLDPVSKTWIFFDDRYGLQGLEFIGAAFLKRKNDQLAFGGVNGMNLFHAADITQATTQTLTHINAVTLLTDKKGRNNQMLRPTKNNQQITLTSAHYGLEVAFTGLHFAAPERIQYRYRLEGLDNQWTQTDASQRAARYTNLRPGEYLFRVSATNPEAIWSDQEATLSILVLTPWWQTLWAMLLYFVLASILVFALIKWRTRGLIKKNLALEKIVEERTANIRQQNKTIQQQVIELKALDRAKEHFFENLSHEFRTPLALIIGPLKQLLGQNASNAAPENITSKLNTPLRQAARLMRLIDQLLEISRLNSGVLKLRRRSFRIADQVRQIACHFADAMQAKDITFSLDLDDRVVLDYDDTAMEKIITNLLSNALNYTESGGQVKVTVTADEQNNAILIVHDTGIGIPMDAQATIFERFHTTNQSEHYKKGIGVGLALVRELVELHGGRIQLTSAPNKGSAFKLVFPIGEIGDIIELDDAGEMSPASVEKDAAQIAQANAVEASHSNVERDVSKGTILIVDDERDMRIYLRELLENYNILLAENGKQGLQIAIEHIPDLVITDVMMPVMDGLELVQALKEHQNTSHIPIILVTAKGGRESKLAGLREGVDDYIVKPFDDVEFCLRVNNILIIREELAKSASHASYQATGASPLPENEQQFVDKLLSHLDEHYTDPDFSVEQMASCMHLEKRQLQRKLKAILDTSPSDYLRTYRLQKAAQLLLLGKPVSVAFAQSGFIGMSHFSKCFKAKYGVSPSHYFKHVYHPESQTNK